MAVHHGLSRQTAARDLSAPSPMQAPSSALVGVPPADVLTCSMARSRPISSCCVCPGVPCRVGSAAANNFYFLKNN